MAIRAVRRLVGILVGLIGLAAGVATPAASRAETYFKASSVLAMCDATGGDSAAKAKQNLCALYLVGVSDALVTASLYARPNDPFQSPVCWPNDVGIDALPATMRSYATAHRQRLDESAARLAADAFEALHGCPKAGPAAGTKPDVVFFSAADLLQRCKDPDPLAGLYCLYYVVGVSDLYAELSSGGVKSVATTPFAAQICYPKDMSDDQPKHAFIAYMKAHPAAQEANAGLTAARALHEAFPCR